MAGCRQNCGKYLDAFLDQALDVKESLDVQEHLRAYACVSRANAALPVPLYANMRLPPRTGRVETRIVRQAMQAPPPPRRWGVSVRAIAQARDVVGVAAAAVLLLVLSAVFVTSQGDNMTQKFVKEASITCMAHTRPNACPQRWSVRMIRW